MYFIENIKKEDIEEMRKDYYTNLIAPMDDMWEEGIIPDGIFFIIKCEDKIIGYFVLDNDNVIIAFYIKEKIDVTKVFKFIIKEKNISKAYVSSYDPIFYNECINFKKNILNNSFLYRSINRIITDPPFDNIIVKEAKIGDIENILRYFDKGLGMTGEWLKYYFTKIIANNSLRLFKLDNKIIGTGEIRPSLTSKGFANIGVTVAKDYRKKTLATYIVSIISKECDEKRYKAICSTTIDNIASQKTLEKSGYQCYHKIYTVLF